MIESNDRAIERYVGGLMSPGERSAFEERMAIDAELRYQVEVERDIVGAIARDAASAPRLSATPSAAVLARLASTAPATSAPTVIGGISRAAGYTAGGAFLAAFVAVAIWLAPDARENAASTVSRGAADTVTTRVTGAPQSPVVIDTSVLDGASAVTRAQTESVSSGASRGESKARSVAGATARPGVASKPAASSAPRAATTDGVTPSASDASDASDAMREYLEREEKKSVTRPERDDSVRARIELER